MNYFNGAGTKILLRFKKAITSLLSLYFPLWPIKPVWWLSVSFVPFQSNLLWNYQSDRPTSAVATHRWTACSFELTTHSDTHTPMELDELLFPVKAHRHSELNRTSNSTSLLTISYTIPHRLLPWKHCDLTAVQATCWASPSEQTQIYTCSGSCEAA